MKTIHPPKFERPKTKAVQDSDRKAFFTVFDEKLLIQIKNAKA